MNGNKIIVGCTVYRLMEQFMNQFLDCFLKQKDKDFTLLLINEDINDLEEKTKKYQKYLKIKAFNAKRGSLMLDNKAEIIKKAIELGADHLIFADSDDLLDENRVAEYRRHLKENDFVYNDLILVNEMEKKAPACPFFGAELPAELNDVRQILDGNFCGFSNSGLNLMRIDFSKISWDYGSVIAFDWWLFTQLLLSGYKGRRAEGTVTFYRVYKDNIAGEMIPLDDKKLGRIFEVKKAHYAFWNDKSPALFREKYDELLGLERRLNGQVERNRFIDQINKKYVNQNVLWWDVFRLN